MYEDLKDKVVVVTGVGRARGIGRATAARFAREGAKLVITDLGKAVTDQQGEVFGASPDLTAAEQELSEIGAEVLSLATDISDPPAVDALFASAMERFGRVDIVVCNAAILADCDVSAFKLDAALFKRVLDVNLIGTFLCAQAGARCMVEGNHPGSIITIGSRASRRGNPSLVAYSASKFAVLGLTQSLALAFAAHQIRVNCVCPGAVDTDMAAAETARHASAQGRTVETLQAEMLAGMPLGRLTSPEDLANAITWFASTQSVHLTGQSLNVNGGSWLD